MSKTCKTLIMVAGILSLAVLGACSREITSVQAVDPGASSCFNCHSDQDTYLVDMQMEWSYSSHAIGAYVDYAGGRSGCSACHSGSGFEADLAGETEVPYPTSIRCFSCHAPHSTADFGLRVTAAQTLPNGVSRDIGKSNICVACHKTRLAVYATVAQDYPDSVGLDQVTVSSSHWGGHHGPQADIFFGSNGYEYEGYTFRTSVPPAHNDEDLARCYGCHGNANSAVDLGGHSFAMVNDADEYNVAGCNQCHSNLTNFDAHSVQSDTEELLHTLAGLLQDHGLLDAEGAPVSKSKGTADQVGALWNYLICEEDRSLGVHNPDYVQDLLQASILVLEGAPE